jgi:hypothetical protein
MNQQKHLKFEENTGKRSEKNKLTQTTTFSLLIAGFKVFIFEITTNQRIDYFVCSVFSFNIYLANLFSKLFARFVYISALIYFVQLFLYCGLFPDFAE